MQIRNYTISGEDRDKNAEFFSDLIMVGGSVLSIRILTFASKKFNVSLMVPEVGEDSDSSPANSFVAKYKDCEGIQ